MNSPSVVLAYSLLQAQPDMILPWLPRFIVGAHHIVVGEYATAHGYDAEFAATHGSGDPLFDRTEVIRFDPKTELLRSLSVYVPEKPVDEPAWLRAVLGEDLLFALPRLPASQFLQVEAADRLYIDAAGTRLVVFRGAPPASQRLVRVRVARDLELLSGAPGMYGWLLHDPARYLVNGWEQATEADQHPGAELAECLSRYLRLIDDRFVQKLEDHDSESLHALRVIASSVSRLKPSAQQVALLSAIRAVIDTFE